MDQDLFPDRQFNISDIIEVIQSSDPAYAAANMPATYNNEGPLLTQQPMDIAAGSTVDMEMEMKKKAYVKILEQPASKALRFRYECEGRSAGSIPGAKSSPEKKTFPKIQVVGYRGPAVVVVSCVTKDPPHRPHPHNLVGKEGCKKGVCTMEINSEEMTTEFSNLGIQCVKRKDLEEALRVREEIRVDPFQTGFSHRAQPTSIDLNALRLCFQVFLEGAEKRRFTLPLKPVLSDTIFDKKAMCDLVICKLSDCSCSVAGDKEIILLCDKVTKDDVQVRFYEERDGLLYWEDFGDFQPSDVHKQVAISFRAPRYKHMDIERPVTVSIQLLRPTDKQTSESRPFQYLPLSTDPEFMKRKRQKLADSNTTRLTSYLQDNSTARRPVLSPVPPSSRSPMSAQVQIKREPPEASTSPYSYPFYMDNTAYNYQPPQSMSFQPSETSPYHQFNVPSAVGPSAAFVPYHAQSVLDLDTNRQCYQAQPELSMANLDSSDLAELPLTDGNLSLLDSHLSENLLANLNLLDNDSVKQGCAAGATRDENMSDSFTRLTSSTIDELRRLNTLSQHHS